MSIVTPWGYDITGDSLPDIVTMEEFNVLTGNRWAADPMAAQAVSAASQAIRNYCGWHVAPALECTCAPGGGGTLLQLPFLGMTAATVSIWGVEVPSSQYAIDRRGLIRRKDGCIWPWQWGAVQVTATAGYAADALLKAVVCQIAGNAIAAPMGVREEHAGQVGITYNASGGIAGGITLTPRDMACLETYRIAEVV